MSSPQWFLNHPLKQHLVEKAKGIEDFVEFRQLFVNSGRNWNFFVIYLDGKWSFDIIDPDKFPVVISNSDLIKKRASYDTAIKFFYKAYRRQIEKFYADEIGTRCNYYSFDEILFCCSLMNQLMGMEPKHS